MEEFVFTEPLPEVLHDGTASRMQMAEAAVEAECLLWSLGGVPQPPLPQTQLLRGNLQMVKKDPVIAQQAAEPVEMGSLMAKQEGIPGLLHSMANAVGKGEEAVVRVAHKQDLEARKSAHILQGTGGLQGQLHAAAVVDAIETNGVKPTHQQVVWGRHQHGINSGQGRRPFAHHIPAVWVTRPPTWKTEPDPQCALLDSAQHVMVIVKNSGMTFGINFDLKGNSQINDLRFRKGACTAIEAAHDPDAGRTSLRVILAKIRAKPTQPVVSQRSKKQRRSGFAATAPSQDNRRTTAPRLHTTAAAAELQRYVDQHTAGDLQAAEAGYRDFLSRHDGFPVAHSNLAALLLDRGAYDEAARLARRAVELQPDYPSAWKNRFEAVLALGQHDEAIKAARQLLVFDPSDGTVANHLALLLAQQGQDEAALATLEALLAQRPDHLACLQTISVLQLRHDPPAAVETTAKALALAPQQPDLLFNRAQALLATGEAEQGERVLQTLLDRQPAHRQGCQRLAGLLDQRGEHEAALDRYEAAVEADQTWSEGWFQLGLRRLQQQRPGGCEAYERLLELDPDHSIGLSNLAVQHLIQGDVPLAAERLERAVELQPDFADALFNLAIVRTQQGERSAAEGLYRQVLARRPGYAKAACNLGTLLNERGAYSDALTLLQEAVRLETDLIEAHFNLGFSLSNLGQGEQAEMHYRRCLELKPDLIIGWLQLGNLLDGLGRHRQALDAYEQLLTLEPDHHHASMNRAIQFLRLRQGAKAVEALQEITAARPEEALAWQQLGNALLETSQYDASLQASDRALALDPTLPVAHSNRGVALQNLKRLDEADACYRQAVQLEPTFTDAHYNLGVLLKERGCFVEAAACYRRAIELRPTHGNALSNLVYLLSFSQIETQQSILAASQEWVKAFCVPKLPTFTQRLIPADRPLRAGVISAEIGNHAVSYFLRSYLKHYDHGRTHVHLYPTVKRDEASKFEMLALVEGCRELHALSDAEARERIIADGIDVLIDTTSHMRGNRLPLLAERCAPVQAHWIGFHGSTAVPTIDWFIGDDEVSPEAFADHFSERLWRLPMPWVCYSPPADAPEPEALVDEGGPVTLGSFNNLLKVGDDCVDLYGQVMGAIPDSRLLLKDVRCEDAFMRQRILDRLGRWGVGPERVELVERVPSWHDHMKLYNRLDVALDTTPLNSGTTGFDALFMGTPLVALRGDWMGGRLTASMLKALGRPEWVADDIETFVATVVALTADRRALRALRHELRRQVLASRLCDGPAMAEAMDDALAGMAQDHNRRLRTTGGQLTARMPRD